MGQLAEGRLGRCSPLPRCEQFLEPARVDHLCEDAVSFALLPLELGEKAKGVPAEALQFVGSVLAQLLKQRLLHFAEAGLLTHRVEHLSLAREVFLLRVAV